MLLENTRGFMLHLWQRMHFTPPKRRFDYIPRYVLACLNISYPQGSRH